MSRDDVEIVKNNLDNSYQLKDAISSVYHQIVNHRVLAGRISFFLNTLTSTPYEYKWRSIDRRWKETKQMEEARMALLDAAAKYDAAVEALNNRIK